MRLFVGLFFRRSRAKFRRRRRRRRAPPSAPRRVLRVFVQVRLSRRGHMGRTCVRLPHGESGACICYVKIASDIIARSTGNYRRIFPISRSFPFNRDAKRSTCRSPRNLIPFVTSRRTGTHVMPTSARFWFEIFFGTSRGVEINGRCLYRGGPRTGTLEINLLPVVIKSYVGMCWNELLHRINRRPAASEFLRGKFIKYSRQAFTVRDECVMWWWKIAEWMADSKLKCKRVQVAWETETDMLSCSKLS